jgi:predicted ABC-type transport system involved in lysophospholipase L1 biosynthesis ATPase subunit
LRITRQAAQTRVAMAAALRSRMPCLLAAMDAGELDEHKARQTVDATAPLPDDLARRVDAIIAASARNTVT